MAKRFGRNQKRKLIERIKELEHINLLGCGKAKPDDFVLDNIRIYDVHLTYHTNYHAEYHEVELMLPVDIAYKLYQEMPRCSYQGRRYAVERIDFSRETRGLNIQRCNRVPVSFRGLPR